MCLHAEVFIVLQKKHYTQLSIRLFNKTIDTIDTNSIFINNIHCIDDKLLNIMNCGIIFLQYSILNRI